MFFGGVAASGDISTYTSTCHEVFVWRVHICYQLTVAPLGLEFVGMHNENVRTDQQPVDMRNDVSHLCADVIRSGGLQLATCRLWIAACTVVRA